MKKIKGTALFESVLGLLLFSICISGIIMFHKSSSYSENMDITKMRANYIRKNIERYVATYGFLPYAAKTQNGEETDEQLIGYLPYKTLGISQEYMKDGFGNPYKFIVNKNLVLKYQEKKKWKIMPPFFPTMYFVPNLKIWSRLNKYKRTNHQDIEEGTDGASYLYDYDEIEENYNITIFKKGKLIKLSEIEVTPIYLDIEYSKLIKYELNKENKNQREKYQVKDLIAWVLISDKKIPNTLSIEITNYREIFWQSRFNLAAQIKSPVTTYGTSMFNIVKIYQKKIKF